MDYAQPDITFNREVFSLSRILVRPKFLLVLEIFNFSQLQRIFETAVQLFLCCTMLSFSYRYCTCADFIEKFDHRETKVLSRQSCVQTSYFIFRNSLIRLKSQQLPCSLNLMQQGYHARVPGVPSGTKANISFQGRAPRPIFPGQGTKASKFSVLCYITVYKEILIFS